MGYSSDLKDTLRRATIEEIVSGRAPRRRGWIALAAAGALAAAAILGFMLFSGNAPPQIDTAVARQGTLSVTVPSIGTLRPQQRVNVGAEISGLVSKVLVKNNDRVRAGQILAVFDTTLLETDVTQARANFRAADASAGVSAATLLQTTQDARRAHGLASADAITQSAIDAADANLARAKAQLALDQANAAKAKAALDSTLATLAKADIRAPIEGFVLERLVEPGQVVAASFETPHLFTLAANLDTMQIEADVREADVARVTPGRKATFYVDAFPDHAFDAVVETLDREPKTENGITSYRAILNARNPGAVLLPGMTATITIHAADVVRGIIVPETALHFTPKTSSGGEKAVARSSVWLVSKDGRLSEHPVRVLGAQDGNVAVGGDIPDGSQVAIGYHSDSE
ncbi:MAG TPA: efflux RND transporter periplasmic adaptor subunit [Rhizomicrobium sp.]|jgi:HlyD family secretion protein|nr:efflux RND transporter periplasmic adaptor subunit [Rhizomicrobium sp.]